MFIIEDSVCYQNLNFSQYVHPNKFQLGIFITSIKSPLNNKRFPINRQQLDYVFSVQQKYTYFLSTVKSSVVN